MLIALLGIQSAAKCAAAVDDHQCELVLRAAGLEAVYGLKSGQLYDLVKDLGSDAAACDVHNFILLLCALDCKRASKTA